MTLIGLTLLVLLLIDYTRSKAVTHISNLLVAVVTAVVVAVASNVRRLWLYFTQR